MKKISILCPCMNEEENVVPLCHDIINELEENLPNYDYEIIFIDNSSTDNTKNLIRELCQENKKVKAIFNAKNYNSNSGVYGLLQTRGDCTISMCTDFQNPVEMLHVMVEEWEKGYNVVCGVKTSSKENKMMYKIRSIYYKIIKKYSSVEQIEHFTGFALYDRKFIEILRDLKDPYPYLRGIVSEFAYKRKDVEFEQPKRRAGRSKMKMSSLYNTAMNGFTSYTKVWLRLGMITGVIGSVLSVLFEIFYCIICLGLGALIQGWVIVAGLIILIGSIQLFFIGIAGEYIMNINIRVMNRPLVIEEERINFQ